MANFSTLVAIIAGLQSEWVTKAMRKSWGRVGIWENRMFKDLKIFTTNSEDFKYIRQVVESIVDAKPLDANTHAASVVSGGGTDTQPGKSKTAVDRQPMTSVCIPFIGVCFSPFF
jgi:GDP/GTP exchange factor required for growth at low temperature